MLSQGRLHKCVVFPSPLFRRPQPNRTKHKKWSERFFFSLLFLHCEHVYIRWGRARRFFGAEHTRRSDINSNSMSHKFQLFAIVARCRRHRSRATDNSLKALFGISFHDSRSLASWMVLVYIKACFFLVMMLEGMDCWLCVAISDNGVYYWNLSSNFLLHHWISRWKLKMWCLRFYFISRWQLCYQFMCTIKGMTKVILDVKAVINDACTHINYEPLDCLL